MAKKQKDEVPDPRSVANRDIMQRLNFLYQASVYLQGVASAIPASEEVPHASTSASSLYKSGVETALVSHFSSGKGKQKSDAKQKRKKTTRDLAKVYIDSMKVVGQKTVVKMDPAVKRTLCKGCNVALLPGSSASVRVKKSTSHGHTMVYTCLNCKTQRRIPAPPSLPVPDMPELQQKSTPQDVPAHDAMTAEGPEPMVIDDISASSSTAGMHTLMDKRRKKKKPPVPRPLLLSARLDAGHAVFCGSEKLLMDEEKGNGIFIA